MDVHDKYLGLWIVIGRSRSARYAYIKNRLWKKLKDRKDKLLSSTWKEIFIKVVGQTLPIYMMNCFLLPKTFCEDLQLILCRFWWGNPDDSKHIHWLSWENMCKPKLEGGLRFRSLYDFNFTILAKQGLRLLHNRDSLASWLLKAKYFSHNSFWDAALDSCPSP